MKSVVNRGIRPTSAAPKREVKEAAPAPTMPKIDEPIEMTKDELEFDQDDSIVELPQKSKKSDSSKKVD
jgi:hypothetical protein